MPSPTDACNAALGEIGAQPINALTDGSRAANYLQLIYPVARDMALELHPWNFASFQCALSRLEDTPIFGWLYQYALPTGAGPNQPPYCLTVQGTDLDPGGPPWEVGAHPAYGRVLRSDEASVKILYTGRVEDTNAWSQIAYKVLVKVLASELAKGTTGQSSLAREKMEEAMSLIPPAKARDGKEGTPMVLRPNTTLVEVRRRGSSRLTRGPWNDGRTW